DGKWVFDRKPNKNGNTIRFKARWVVKGFSQVKGIDYDLTYAAVVNAATNRALLAVTAALNWPMRQYDVATAFLNGELPDHQIVYMKQPLGFKEGRGDLVCELRQDLYRLKQSAKLWYDIFTSFLLSIGFRISQYDTGLLIHD